MTRLIAGLTASAPHLVTRGVALLRGDESLRQPRGTTGCIGATRAMMRRASIEMSMRQQRTGREQGGGRSSAARRVRVGAFILVSLLAIACRKSESASPIRMEPRAAKEAPAAEPAPPTEEAPANAGESERVFERKLVKDAELEVEVVSYADARRVLDRRLAAVQGYVADATVSHEQGEVSSAKLVLRVPASALESFMRECAALGTVRSEQLHTRDVTDEYYDAEARLTNARKLEARLLELVATKADSVKDLLEVERELARVREQIETTQGKLKLFDSQVSFSKLTLHLATRQRFEGGKPMTFGEQVGHAFGESWRALGRAARGGTLVLVVLLPWLLPLGLLGGFMYLMLRWLARRDRARAQARRAQGWASADASAIVPGAATPPPVSPEPPAAPPMPPGQGQDSAGD